MVTRLLQWPGGDLFINAAAGEADTEPKLTVRVSDAARNPISGFDHADCCVFTGDAVRHKVTWTDGRSMNDFAGKTVRLEIFLQNANLFTITAQ